MNIKYTYTLFSPIIGLFVVLFVYVSRIFNKFFKLVALRIYKNIKFVFISKVLSYQHKVVLSVSQYLKTYKRPQFCGLLCELINLLNF